MFIWRNFHPSGVKEISPFPRLGTRLSIYKCKVISTMNIPTRRDFWIFLGVSGFHINSPKVVGKITWCNMTLKVGWSSTTVAQLVRALHRNRRATGSIPARGHIVAFFATALG